MSIKRGQEIARKFKSLNLNPVPVGVSSKAPLRERHNTEFPENNIEDYDFNAIGISTGVVSSGLEALDFDLKNAEDPDKIMEAFKKKVPKSLLEKLVVQTTISGGYHFIYRCEEISSSKKLAKNSQGLAIIETRGEGGYIKCAPSKGYKVISKNNFNNIPIITPEERLTLFVAAKLLNKNIIKDSSKRVSKEEQESFKRFPEYNGSIEVGIALLEKHGWTQHSEDEEWIQLTRPNSKSGDIHAGYHKEGKFLFVFSTAQETFEQEKPYNNHAIYAELECEGDYSKAYAQLYEEGHGVELNKVSEKKQSKLDWKQSLDCLEFLSDPIEENTYLEQARKDEIQQGLTTGWGCLDEYFRLKENSLNFGLGFDGVGKSVFMLNVAQASNLIHDWRWGMIMPENRTAMSRRRLIECKSGKNIAEFKDDRLSFSKHLEDCRKNFHIISNKKHYTIKEVLEMGKRLYEVNGIKALLIDPYNFFKVNGNGYSLNNEILSQMRVFVESYCSIFVMAHPNSTTARDNFDSNGYLLSPSKYSIQGGADFPYRVDNFFSAHRITNHQSEEARRVMQIKVEKIKEIETGGKVHGKEDYTPLVFERRDGFLGYWDEEGNNPMYKAIKAKMEINRGMSYEEAF